VQRTTRLTLLVTALVVALGALVLSSAAGAPSGGTPFEAQFNETNVSLTNRIADLGVAQRINTGTGTVHGFGSASVVVGITSDLSVQPCGPGSSTNAAVRRIVLHAGVLVIRELAYICQTASGPRATGTWTVDGHSSTGAFAGASGKGDITVQIPIALVTLSGTLKLAGK
jgi:hypothetical protein